MLRILICLLALFAWTYADFETLRSCNTTKKRFRWFDEIKPNGTELNAFNEMFGVYLSDFLDFFDVPTHLKFDCNLAGGADLNIRKGFDLIQTQEIDGEYNINKLKPHFVKMANQVLTKILKYTKKKKWYDCLTKCWRDPASTFLFGCNYKGSGSTIGYRCSFEKVKKH